MFDGLGSFKTLTSIRKESPTFFYARKSEKNQKTYRLRGLGKINSKNIQMEENRLTTKTTAPNSVVALVLGITSLVFGCFFVGLVCGIIGLVLANKGLTKYKESPSLYNGCGMLTAGKVTSIIGIIFGGIYTLWYIICILILGASFGFSELFN